MKDIKISYDIENDDLFIHKNNEKSTRSVELGDMIFDFNKNKTLVGIEFINASKTLFELTKNKEIKEILTNLKNCTIDTKNKGNLLLISITLISNEKEISQVISIPSIKEKSPALAYA